MLDTRTAVPPARARTLTGRFRAAKSALLTAGQTWPHPDLRIRSGLTGFHGLGAGHGRLQALDTEVATLDRAGRTRTTLARLADTGAGTAWTSRTRTAHTGRTAVARVGFG